MTPTSSRLFVVAGIMALACGLGPAPDDRPAAATKDRAPAGEKAKALIRVGEGRLGMTPAVACRSIKGYKDYVPLKEPAVTKDEKLLLYFEPQNYAVERVKGKYRAHFTQDVKIRRRGKKPVVWSKDNLLDYTAEEAKPPTLLSLTNTIAVKGLAPGGYDLDIILRDEVAGGPPASQVFRFQVKPSPTARKDNKPGLHEDDLDQVPFHEMDDETSPY